MPKATGCCPRCYAPVYGKLRLCQRCKCLSRREHDRQEIREAGERAELVRTAYDNTRPRYSNPPDARGLMNVEEFLKDACPWATRKEVQSMWPKPTHRPVGEVLQEAAQEHEEVTSDE